VTHDIGETQHFSRVLVIEDGRLVEDASPQILAADPASRYHALLSAENAVRRELWEGAQWRRLTVMRGGLKEE